MLLKISPIGAGDAGQGFTPHVINVLAGEVCSKTFFISLCDMHSFILFLSIHSLSILPGLVCDVIFC